MAALLRLTWLALAALGTFVLATDARAADCPTDHTGYTPLEWDESYTSTGTFSVSHFSSGGTRCGYSINAQTNYTSGGHATFAAGYAAMITSQTASGATLIGQCTYDNGTTSQGVQYIFQNAAGTLRKAARVYSSVSTADCTPVEEPDDFDCAALANVNTLGHADDMLDSFTPGDEICVKDADIGGVNTPMNCAAFKRAEQKYSRQGPTGLRDWLVNYQFTGLACTTEPQQEETEPMDDEDNEKCTTGSGGLTWCKNPNDTQDKDCGYFNDQYVCLDSLDDDKCATKADGSRLCHSNAPSPPVPDDGTPGSKAPPDDTLTTGDGDTSNTYNYYNSTTNSGSDRDTGTGSNDDGSGAVGPGGTPAGTGTGTDGEGEGDDPTADDSAAGGTTCSAQPTCDGDPIQCNLLMQQWKTRCPDGVEDAEWQAAMGATESELSGDLGEGIDDVEIGEFSAVGGLTAGSCPAPIGISVMGQSISLDVWHAGCDMALLFAPFVMAMGYFAAAMLFVRGGGI